jgi:hypothetical protein
LRISLEIRRGEYWASRLAGNPLLGYHRLRES